MTTDGNTSLKQLVQQHPCFTALETWHDKIKNERPENFQGLPFEAKAQYVRLRWLITKLTTRLRNSNPFIVSTSLLERINSQLSKLQTPWSQYLSNPEGHTSQLQAFNDQLLEIAQIVFLGNSGDEKAWIELLDQATADTKRVNDDAETKLAGLGQAVTEQTTKLTDLSAKMDGFKTEIDTQKTRIDQLITQQSEAFTKTQTDRVEKFTQWTQEKETATAALLKEFKTAQETTAEEWEKSGNAVIENLNRKQEEAISIVGTIVNTTMSGNYDRIAAREYKNALWMRMAAIASFIVMGAMIVWAVAEAGIGSNGFNLGTFAIRLSLGFTFLIPGIYCAREASRHWAYEKHNRRLALELAALRPFIEMLTDEKQKEIIERKADEYFGKATSTLDDDDSLQGLTKGLVGDQPSKILKEVLGFVERIVKLR